MRAEALTPVDAIRGVERALDDAAGRGASDVHLEPTAEGYEVRYRVDGLLEVAAHLDAAAGRSFVTRLMVLAKLLTYRLDLPQEGRAAVNLPALARPVDLRVAVIPTTHGLRAAVRLPAELTQPRTLGELGLPAAALDGLRRFATAADAGMLVVTGPAGSGKTTTLYALLRFIADAAPGQSLISLEDPVERDVPGVTQIEVRPFGELTYERALRSLLRQDPQVLMLGEIRDGATASLALQAALSGHRLLCTLHAASPGGAVARLLEMRLEPYQVAGALFGVLSQRLLRRRLDDGSGYRGRVPIAEFAAVDEPVRRAILQHSDASAIQQACLAQSGYETLRAAAGRLVAAGATDEAEVRRVLGDATG